MQAVKKTGKEAQLAIAYTISEVHTADYFEELGGIFAEMGADSICIKDMAGILTPTACRDLVKRLIARTQLPNIVQYPLY